MRTAHINTTSELSTGRIALSVCESLQQAGHAALFCYSHGGIPENVPGYRIGSRLDTMIHAAFARLLDCAGFLSRRATRRLVRQLALYKPDVVHLHNLHAYYLNLPILMRYLQAADIPVVWTLHDCWAFTGHCAHYSMARCGRFASGCHHCPNKRQYPASWGLDRSKQNYLKKRVLFTALRRVSLIAPSQWLAGEAQKSYLNKYPVRVLPSGIDLQAFRPADEAAVEATALRYGLKTNDKESPRYKLPVILSVASAWRAAKGINDLMDLQEMLRGEAVIAVVGLTPRQMGYLPPEMIGVPMIYGKHTMRELYTAADICISLSYEESQGLTLVEALACGTQVVCYNQTALPEIVTEDTGMVVPARDVQAAAEACRTLLAAPKAPEVCRNRALAFDAGSQFSQYVALYEELAEDIAPEAQNGVR
ncbi:MAG: glycosyltransferase [Eubacteriales bacterium]|nr:glycosyltransferase [Eubacteriales bacterium]